MRISQLFAGPYDGGPRAQLFSRVADGFSLPDELRQQLILARRPGWQALAGFGRPGLALPFRRWPAAGGAGRLDRRSRAAVAAELELFKPDVIAVWDEASMARLPAQPEAVTLGIATDPEAALALRRCRYLVALSPEIAGQAVDRGWPEERVRPLPPFADGDLVDPLPRATLATSVDATVVLLPWTLDLEALGAVLLAARRLPLPTLWMPGVDRKRLKLALGCQVPLRDLGPELDRARAFAAADLVLCTAAGDAMGLGIVEAWAQTKPVVAAGAPAASGLVRHEDSGLLARDTTPDALAAALRRPLDDPLLYDRLAANGRAAFDAGHGEARALARWLEAYLSLSALMLPGARGLRETRRKAPPPRTDIEV
ncbi:Glycosyl transferases group 1 [Tistlia consotensis]|uniref:Glycosyl transferases group 1 n=1 Tax=Tistlia consotensis USBA 355 TaxID=560819 RepID=A0A1Y6B4B1_9PROT|nr:glycosyltransferase [Tistlia consotensis]SME89293.1 Glycosyl transferases group 1 [Tistlia consotensis USBA 355]SNR25852.1 Glycosyl transferases group 1 [Tistlia consotensis]